MKHANVAFFIPHIGCPNRCSFCNQNTISGKNELPCGNDIKITLNNALNSMPSELIANSEIAFFGGSFTAIDREYMLELLNSAQPFIKEGAFRGIRVSTRPDAIDDEIIDILKKYNVKSVELGAQSMDDEVLKANFRGHSSEDVIKSSQKLIKNGFSLGLQMMTGLYKDTPEKAILTAKKIIELKPDTVRIYPTVVLKGTYLEKLYLEGKYIPLNVEESVTLCAELMEMFENNNVNVIRAGLHDGPDLKENFVAGAYHPALGELIIGEKFYNKIKKLLDSKNIKNATVLVNPKQISQFLGQKRRNLEKFSSEGYDMSILPDVSVKFNEIKLR